MALVIRSSPVRSPAVFWVALVACLGAHAIACRIDNAIAYLVAPTNAYLIALGCWILGCSSCHGVGWWPSMSVALAVVVFLTVAGSVLRVALCLGSPIRLNLSPIGVQSG